MLSIVSCSSKPGDESTPTPDQIIDKYVQALGGQAAIEKITSRVIKGSIEWAESSGVAEHYLKAPNKYMSVTTFADKKLQEGFNGSSGWGLDPKGRLIEWTSNEIAASERSRDFYKEIRLKSIYPSIVFKEKEKVLERDAYELELTPASGKPEFMYFDAETGLLVKQAFEIEGPQGPRPYVYYYQDYRDVDGVKVPFTITRRKPTPYTIKVSEVIHNVAIDDGQFNKPATPTEGKVASNK
jgi:hypothetical protein